MAVLLLIVSMLLHPVAQVFAQQAGVTTNNTATATYSVGPTQIEALSNQVMTSVALPLIDPIGQILGCNGQPLADYSGFSMALYEPDGTGLGLGNLVTLTPTVGADSIPPNTGNINPFALDPATGIYNFLLDENQGQTDAGTQYILVINPPANSPFTERRVRIEMLGVTRIAALNSVRLGYRATSLDGQPISIDGQTELTRTVEIRDAAFQTLTFFTLGINAIVCEPNQIDITKSADRSAAAPGDVIVYRLSIRNRSSVDIRTVTGIDTLPSGFVLIPDSVSAQVGTVPVNVSTAISNNRATFVAEGTLGPDAVLDIIYAVRLTPDALRGSGRNSAIVTARRTDNGFLIQDGPSQHRTTVDPGIVSDCGTLIGRVFEDKNFDGEQQPGEAGIPNAVIFMDDGNRIVTDADGLFSVQKVLPGRRTGTLDLSSLPGYTLAANTHFIERNSHSRLVNLAPGGLVRMNFGVTPTFQEVQED
ncbi:MAG: hypothetical protein AAFS04_11180 [Cyanobacteria bacterium J06631_9]